MGNHLVLVTGLLLSSCLPMKAQIPAAQIVLPQTSPSLIKILFRAPQVPASLIVLTNQLPRKPVSYPVFLLAAAYKPEPSLESRLPIEVFRTPFLKKSSFLIAHFWRGLQMDGFESTLHSQNPQFGSPASSVGFQDFRPSSHDQAGVTSSVRFYGISLRYSLGRDAETRKPIAPWRSLSRIVGPALN
jgi:hypothetical protein